MKAVGEIIIVLCLLLVSVPLHAADYKAWLPLLPKTLGGLARSDKPDGINTQKGGQALALLNQEYSNGFEKKIELTIASGTTAPQNQLFQHMSTFQMETKDELVKRIDISGYKAVFQMNKKSKKGSLLISLDEQTVVTLEVKPVKGEKELVALTEQIPLHKIASQSK